MLLPNFEENALQQQMILAIEAYENYLLSLNVSDEIKSRIKSEKRDTWKIFDEFDLNALPFEERHKAISYQRLIYELDEKLAKPVTKYTDFDK